MNKKIIIPEEISGRWRKNKGPTPGASFIRLQQVNHYLHLWASCLETDTALILLINLNFYSLIRIAMLKFQKVWSNRT